MSAVEERQSDQFVSLRIPTDLVEAIEKLAKQNDRSRSAEIRVALTLHVEQRAA